MSVLFPALGFGAPWLLWALLPLPLIWLLLRVIPPAPTLRRFPGVVLLLGLDDADTSSARTPWWLLALRIGALMAAIVGFAGPVLNPKSDPGQGTGPLLLITDATWADASAWAQKREGLQIAAEAALRAGRPLALVTLNEPVSGDISFAAGDDLPARIAALQPTPWEPDSATMAALAEALPDANFDTLWQSDGLARKGREALTAALQTHGRVIVQEGAQLPVALSPTTIEDGKVATRILRLAAAPAQTVDVLAIGLDPTGVERELARQTVALQAADQSTALSFDLPPELRNRLTRLEVSGAQSAGAVSLTDDALRRRKVALVQTGTPQEGLDLLDPAHYLRQALSPTTDLIEGGITDLLTAVPDVVIMPDLARLPQSEADKLAQWVDEGGLLVRFSGPRLAAAIGEAGPADTLLPVPLRPGDRTTGGAMSWGAPRAVAPFPQGSPFLGLEIPDEVTVTTQVLAEPSPELASHTIAALDDGTPLVTRATYGQGQIVLFHVSASADWSALPLSGLFMSMLDRLAISARSSGDDAKALVGTIWQADKVLDGFGRLGAAGNLPGVAGEALATQLPGSKMPPGLYHSDGRSLALNVIAPGRSLEAARWPASVYREALGEVAQLPLKGWVLAAALVLLLSDLIGTLKLSGLLARPRRRGGSAALLLIGVLTLTQPPGAARADADIEAAAGGMALAYVQTGDQDRDMLSHAGLLGLSAILTTRTSVEPGQPFAVDLEKDDLSVFAFLYWPISPNQPAPSPAAYERLNRFIHTGGMILFDTHDADISVGGTISTPEGDKLQELAAPLDIPPLGQIPSDHVLTRSFYLLSDFPGRLEGAPVWAEAVSQDSTKDEGMPFRNLNDGVTPVVIGGNDWAAAWAVDEGGNTLYRVGRGQAGERQREMAYRFGVNLIMHVLTGNYKSDQVHVPDLLERLGQ